METTELKNEKLAKWLVESATEWYVDISYYERLVRILETEPEILHLRVGENTSACMRGGDKTIAQVLGHMSIEHKELVGCKACLEWMHSY